MTERASRRSLARKAAARQYSSSSPGSHDADDDREALNLRPFRLATAFALEGRGAMLTRMGIHVHFAVATDRVSDAAWREIYEKARHVASLWAPRPLGIAWRNIGVVRVAQYTPHLETTEGLHIVGDMESLRTGESFVFPATLAHACVVRAVKRSPAPSHDDALVAVAAEQAGKKLRSMCWTCSEQRPRAFRTTC